MGRGEERVIIYCTVLPSEASILGGGGGGGGGQPPPNENMKIFFFFFFWGGDISFCPPIMSTT